MLWIPIHLACHCHQQTVTMYLRILFNFSTGIRFLFICPLTSELETQQISEDEPVLLLAGHQLSYILIHCDGRWQNTRKHIRVGHAHAQPASCFPWPTSAAVGDCNFACIIICISMANVAIFSSELIFFPLLLALKWRKVASWSHLSVERSSGPLYTLN